MTDVQASVDQAIAAQVEVARMTRAYFEQLVRCGFTDEQALELAGTYEAAIVAFAGRR